MNTNPKPLKAVLFDLDGTLLDTEGQYTEIWGRIARKFRPDVPRLEYIIKGRTLKQILEQYFPDPRVQAAILEDLNDGEAGMSYNFFPGALEFIEDLRANGVKCALVTSSNNQKMSIVRAKIPGFDKIFDALFTAEMFKASKPDPYCYLLAAKHFNAEPEECVVFEDAPNGLKAGMAAGIFTVGIASGHTPEEIRELCNWVSASINGFSYAKLREIILQFYH
ncbi:MAG: HAD family phosphatase [Bacteroidales bacterium]|nr:HAD family phosphatase [Bacteroidales bacterium]